ncbi:MAG TPA: toxin-activating lysine-acyltransferase [Syntrophales bacterium]|jgi:cytolysin-activating lysine-acyltransferase|nr:toxin-activating lysine-acyltransferase [Syntrophales bacterium]
MTENKEAAGGQLPRQQAELVKLAVEQAKLVFKKLPLLGPVCFLAMNSPAHRFMFVADFEWRILPPVVLDQAKVYMRDESPVAFASWAFLSKEVADRYRKIGRLAPPDWKSGDEPWLIDVIAPFGSVEEVVKDLKTNTSLAGKTTRMLGPKVGDEQGIIEF